MGLHHVITNKNYLTAHTECHKLNGASFLPNLINFSPTAVIFGRERRASGAWAGTMVVRTVGSNPVQSLEVEQHNVVPITDCFTQLFSTSVNLED